MKTVSQNSDAEIAKNRAREGLHWRVRQLTANLMRIVRGAGSSHDISDQLTSLHDAYDAYQAALGREPAGHEIQQALAPPDERNDRDDFGMAKELIVSGALRLAAGRLLGQDLQARNGENEMMMGVRDYWEIREENRRKMRAEIAGKRSRAKRPARRSRIDL
jgi:hypothetical protein